MPAPSYFHRITSLCLFATLFCFGSLNAQSLAEQMQQLKQAKQIRMDSETRLADRLHLILGHYQMENGLPITALVSSEELALAFDLKQYLDPLTQKVGIRIQTEQAELLLPELEKIGFVLTGSAPEYRFLEGYLAPQEILALDGLEAYGLISATAFANPLNDTGSVSSQADTSMQAYRVRGTAPDNFDGTGVNVGVLSDSYDFLGGAAAGITSGDLPAAGVTVIQDDGTSDEGRAMLEIVHDIAPGAGLFFATAFGGEANFAANIQNLATVGCGVIVDDIVYLEEPFFQDGIIAQIVENVTLFNDAIYFSSAGNRAVRAYENTAPTIAVDPISTADALDFDPTAGVDFYQQFTLNDGEQFRAALQWDDPWYTVAGVDTDLDFVITDDPPTTILAVANDDNILSQIPSELVTFTDGTVDGLPQTYNVFITKFGGPDPGRLKYVNFGTHTLNEFDTQSPTVNPHAGAVSCVAVAAVLYSEAVTEDFSSHGPSTFLFDNTGTALGAPAVRAKPDFAANDGANNTFFGADLEGDGFPNFFGTSAAAPHAAGMAAILRQAFPAANRDAIYNTMVSSTTDVGIAGVDSVAGAGMVDVYRAIYPTPIPASLDVIDGLETANFSRAWELNYPGAGRIRPNTAFGPAGGTNHLTMDAWFGSNTNFKLNEAILHFDATFASNITLSFDQFESGDEDDLMPVTFAGSTNADGVALSVDGTNWFRLFDLTGVNSPGAYANKSINISNFATVNAITLGADVRIKFQQYDNFPFPSDGFAFDNISITGTVLPVNLLSFQAETAPNQRVMVSWETAMEVDNERFILERSRDGVQFEGLSELPGAGTSEIAQSYQYLDHNPYQGRNYYRLWQVDRDGSKTLSEVVSVFVERGNALSVFPNPIANEQLAWQYEATENGIMKIEIVDLNGRRLQSVQQSVELGLQQYQLDVSSLPAGTYILKATNAKTYRSVQRFTKL
ncbi:MAG: S8 family serine peptidase [Bacteroidota bacterium]